LNIPWTLPVLHSSLAHDSNDNAGNNPDDSARQCYEGDYNRNDFEVRNEVVVPRLVVLHGWESHGPCDYIRVVAIVAVIGEMCVV
jgi:hypothetical protein